ncbi:MAG: MBL fold metallo-hydrolase [Candidatus Harrisonbacteria bacterium]|nr:MBL fold metallo-hydrolase [Candidatus Harrisonbacteria bacterium]
MVINYCGGSCFKIQSGKLSIVVNPLPRFKGDITFYTENAPTDWPPTPGHIYGPGEYEIQETEIRGWSAKSNTSTYLAVAEEIRLCFLGELGDVLEPGLLDKIGEIDILFAPAKTAGKIIKQLQPKIVIPFFKKSDELKTFLKDLELKSEEMDKLTIKKKELESSKMKVIVLKV